MSLLDKSDIFLSVIESHKGIIYKVANAYCKDAEDRKDLVQEVIIKLWQSFHKYDNKYKLSTWIYRIALNTAISHYRSDYKRQQSTVSIYESLLEIADDNDKVELDNNVQLLYGFINQFDEMNKALMILYLDNNSYKDISEILGISETNVATKIARLKQRLKLQFERI